MALSKSYLSVKGELYAEWTEGTSKTEVGYIRDALGNVMETVNSGGNTVNTYNYKPFGDVLSKTGSAPDPKYLWCGTWGYRASGNKWVSHYVRARHYSFADAAWTSIDPYGYVENRVMTASDPSGMKPMSSPSTGGLNYGCNSYPCCGSNTWYLQNECEKTGRRFECCAARVSKGICTTVHLAKFNCDTYGCFDVLPGSGLDKYFRWRISCELWPRLDCQNSCMRYQHQIKRHSSWSWASRVCRRYGPQSERCCEASFRVEQKEYEFCARNCFGSLNAIPYDLRIGMGLQGLECCKEKSRRKPWNQSR